MLYSGSMQTTRQFRKTLDHSYVALHDERGGSSAQWYDTVNEALVFARELVEKLTADRDSAVAEVYAFAGSYQSVADALGMSRARVQQLVERSRG